MLESSSEIKNSITLRDSLLIALTGLVIALFLHLFILFGILFLPFIICGVYFIRKGHIKLAFFSPIIVLSLTSFFLSLIDRFFGLFSHTKSSFTFVEISFLSFLTMMQTFPSVLIAYLLLVLYYLWKKGFRRNSPLT